MSVPGSVCDFMSAALNIWDKRAVVSFSIDCAQRALASNRRAKHPPIGALFLGAWGFVVLGDLSVSIGIRRVCTRSLLSVVGPARRAAALGMAFAGMMIAGSGQALASAGCDAITSGAFNLFLTDSAGPISATAVFSAETKSILGSRQMREV